MNIRNNQLFLNVMITNYNCGRTVACSHWERLCSAGRGVCNVSLPMEVFRVSFQYLIFDIKLKLIFPMPINVIRNSTA